MIKQTFIGDIMCDVAVANKLENYLDNNTGEYNFDSIFSHAKVFFKNLIMCLEIWKRPFQKQMKVLQIKGLSSIHLISLPRR